MKAEDRRELVKYRLAKARETFNEVPIHQHNKLWNTAVNRLYYACYYAVTALLLEKEIEVRTHAGVRQMFGLHFIKKGIISQELGKFYSDIFDMRQTGDYEDYTDFKEEDVADLIQPAGELISKIEELIK